MTESAGLTIVTFAKRPDLLDKVFGCEIQSAMPEFMRHDPTAALYFGGGQLDHYREFGLVAVDPAAPDRPVARAFSVPFAFRDGTKGREELPDGGSSRPFVPSRNAKGTLKARATGRSGAAGSTATKPNSR